MRIMSYELNSQVTRATKYKVKTAFHEAFHAKADGLETDIIKARNKWIDMEEFFAETSSHYIAKQVGINDLTPSYPNKIVKWAPRLQRVDKYSSCTTLFGFGKIGLEDRLNGIGSVWGSLYDQVSSMDFDWIEYSKKYVKDIRENKEFLIDKILENMPQSADYKSYMLDDLNKV